MAQAPCENFALDIKALGALLKKQSPRENLGLLAKVLQMQSKLCKDAPTGYFADVMLALVEGIATGAFKLDNTSAGHLRKYDAQLKVISEGSLEGLKTAIPQILFRTSNSH